MAQLHWQPTRRIAVLVAFMLAWIAAAAGAPWPAGVEARLELGVPGGAPADCNLRISDFAMFGRLGPANTSWAVFDDLDNRLPAVERKTPDGRSEVFFPATAGRRHYLCWGRLEKPAALAVSLRAGDSDPLDDELAALEAEIGRPFVEALPGRLLHRPQWERHDGVCRQLSGERNVFMVTRETFGDGIFSVRVHPGRAQYAGVAFRCGNPLRPDRTGIYWLLGHSPKEGAEGYNHSYGIVNDDKPGPQLRSGVWNTLTVEMRGRSLRLLVNGALAKTIEAPDALPAAGHLALATFGGQADFDDIEFRALDGGKVLFADDFAGAGLLDSRSWLLADGSPAGGLLRVVNTSAVPQKYEVTIAYHRDPWALRNRPLQRDEVAPGAATPWMPVASLVGHSPLTLHIYPVRPSPEVSPGTVQFAAHPFDEALLRALPIPPGETLVVECTRAGFLHEEELRADIEIGRGILDKVRAMTFKGRIPERFPIGYPGGGLHSYQAGREIGFNAATRGMASDKLAAMGYRHLYTHNHLLTTGRHGIGYRREVNRAQALKMAESLRAEGREGAASIRISVYDEAGGDVGAQARRGLPDLGKDPNAWSQLIATAGLEPRDFHPEGLAPPADAPLDPDYWKRLGGAKPDAATVAADPAAVYRTLKVWQAVWPTRFGNMRDALREAFGEDALVTANIHYSAFFKDDLSGTDPWMMYSRLRCLDVPQVCDYNVYWPQQEEWLIDLLRCGARPHNGPVDAYLAAQAGYLPRPPESLGLCAMSAIGAGAKSLSYYEWGPRYAATENWYADDAERLRVIGGINHAVGWVEDILLDGGPPQPPVAILYSRPGELWDRLAPAPDIARAGVYLAERRQLYHLLRGLHRQVDMLHDEVLPREQGTDIDKYQVIFMSQRCITEKGAAALLDWVGRGGTLVALVSCGQFDELARPWDRMLGAFGLRSLRVEFPAAGETREIAGVQARTMFGVAEPGAADVLARFADGTPAMTEMRHGKGRLRYVAWAPGSSYHLGVRLFPGLRLLLDMQEAVRAEVGRWLEFLPPPRCATDHPLVSARLIESPHGRAVVLVNSTGERRLAAVEVTLRGPVPVRVESLEHGPLPIREVDGGIAVKLPLDLTDVLRLTD